MIRLENFSIGFKERQLLEEVSLSFKSPGLTALLGRNGSGKSTLLRSLCRLNESYRGQIFINDLNLKKIPRLNLAREISYVNTCRPRIANLKSWDIVALGRSPYSGWSGYLTATDRQIIESALEEVGMSEYKIRSVDTLSDGEFQKIMIARALAQNTDIMILDEPTSFLDLPTRYELVMLLKNLVSLKKKTIIFSTHELDIALELADYIALIDNNQLINLTVSDMVKTGNIQKLFKTPGKYIDRLINVITDKKYQ